MNLNHRTSRDADRRSLTDRWTGSDLRARYDSAVTRAQGCEATGDKVDAERFYQQADHFRRLLNGRAA